ncbi:MAG: hypothetical protein RSF86_14850 [Angelakisella sp.]
MKKFIALVLATTMLLAVCATASADTVSLLQNPIPAQAVSTVVVTDSSGVWRSGVSGRLYVRHYLWSTVEGYYGSNNHTNYFQAFLSSNTTSRLGGNWMAPSTANYIRSGSIQTGSHYGVAARANTKYADAGFPSIRISGYADGQA